MIAVEVPVNGAGAGSLESTTMVPLSGKHKRALRARAHHLSPVVSVGAHGPSDAVIAELEVALDDHELVKLRIAADDREHRKNIIESLCERTNAELVQRIGHTAVVYRARPVERDQI
jgi:RNA-binding protein